MNAHLACTLLSMLLLGGGLAPRPAHRAPPALPSSAGADALPEVVEGGKRGSRRLVLVLHGGSYRPRTPRELAERAVEPLEDAARRAGLRLAAPVVPEGWLSWGARAPDGNGSSRHDASSVWSRPEAEALVLAYLDQELRRKRADPDRVYLAAHGAGVTSAIQLAARHPERFAALALWSGTPSPVWMLPAGGVPARGRPGGAGRLGAPRVVGLVGDPVPRLAGVGVYLWTGHDDDILDREALALFVTAMRDHEQRGTGHRLVWETGPGGHGYGPRGARAGLEFLKGCRRPKRR